MEYDAEKYGFTATGLKTVAMVTMIIDHFFAFTYFNVSDVIYKSVMGYDDFLYQLGRGIGRIAFILFAFLIAQGLQHTHSRWKYLRNLLVFAFITELPCNLLHSGRITFEDRNVLFTFSLAVMAVIVGELLQGDNKNPFPMLFSMVAFMAVGHMLDVEYGGAGVMLVVLFYLGKNYYQYFSAFAVYLVVYCLLCYLKVYGFGDTDNLIYYCGRVFDSNWMGVLSLLFIGRYNGNKGRGINKWVGYCFYPTQFFVFFLINKMIEGAL